MSPCPIGIDAPGWPCSNFAEIFGIRKLHLIRLTTPDGMHAVKCTVALIVLMILIIEGRWRKTWLRVQSCDNDFAVDFNGVFLLTRDDRPTCSLYFVYKLRISLYAVPSSTGSIGRVSYITIYMYLCYFCFWWKALSLVQASMQHLMHHVTVSLQKSKITLQNNCINNTSITQPTLSFYLWLKM